METINTPKRIVLGNGFCTIATQEYADLHFRKPTTGEICNKVLENMKKCEKYGEYAVRFMEPINDF